MNLLSTVAWVSKILLLLNILFLIITIVRTTRRSKPMGLLLVLLVGTFGIEITSEILANSGIENLYLTHYYSIGQLLVLALVYNSFLERFKITIPIGVTLFSSIFLFQLIDGSILYNKFNTTGFLVSACVLMSFAFFYFIEHISEKKYWDTFNLGLFLYLGGSSIIFLTMNSWKDLEGWNMIIWTVNALLSVLFQLFVSLTIYRYYRGHKSQNGISSI